MSPKLSKRQHTVNSRAAGPARTPAGDAFSALVVQIFRLHNALAAAGDALARPAGQTSARWQVLAAIEDEPRTVAGIARAYGLARQSVQRIADLVAKEALAGYEKNPADRRSDLLRLTGSGRAALRRIQAAQRVWADRLGAELGERHLRQAGEVLARALTQVASGRHRAPPPASPARGVPDS